MSAGYGFKINTGAGSDRRLLKIIRGAENIAAAIAKFQSNIRASWCACVDSSIPAFSMSDTIKQGYISAKKKGVRIRYVTEITRENLQYCKELAKFVELRHLDVVKGSFAVSESEFVAGIRGAKALAKLIYNNDSELVSSQQDVFETLWASAAPARDIMSKL